MSRLTAENVTLAYDQRVIAENLSVAIPDRSFTVIVGPNACGKSTLLRALADAQAGRRVGAAGRLRDLLAARQEGRQDARAAAAVLDRAGRDHRGGPGGAWPLSAPGAAAAVVGRRRADRAGVDGRHRRRRAGRTLCRRAVRRAAAAGVDRDGARPADTAVPARRADDVSGHPAPDRGAGPVRRAARGAGADAGRRPARPQPRGPLRDPSDRHEGRCGPRRGRAGRHRHGGAGGTGLRARLPDHRGPGDRHTAGRPGRAQAPSEWPREARTATGGASDGGDAAGGGPADGEAADGDRVAGKQADGNVAVGKR